jgi:predicted ribosome quality control (RQC) complex YloA/Tae2 family protein
MSIRWDSLLAHHLASELHQRFAGSRLRAIRLDGRTRDALFFFRDVTLVWRLHPDRAYPMIAEPIEPEDSDLRLRARLRSVRAPADERAIHFEFTPIRGGGSYHEVLIELMGNRLNAIVTEGPDRRIRHVLKTSGGSLPRAVGQPYVAPPPTNRAGAAETLSAAAWEELVGPIPPPDRAQWLVRNVAWVSPINVESLLADDDGGFEQWRAIVSGKRAAEPTLLDTPKGLQPYPFTLAGTVAEPAPESLMDAFAKAAASDERIDAPALTIGPGLLARLEENAARADRRVVRLTAQLDRREDPETLRATGDLLLARYADVAAGAESVSLTDFSGEAVVVKLDPKRAVHENAAGYYDRAARSERAGERLPGLIAQAITERDRIAALLEGARLGTTTAEEIRSVLPEGPRSQRRGDQEARLPYTSFRSSGGLEIRVGRGARHNDDLTFRASAPNDIWLHARHAAGAHVILRWQGEGSPPGRDLEEAAVLAALNSKARTSSSVPVDWTLRKYVRKPRGAAPGSVLPDRVKTVFVEPDESLPERLSDGA